MGKYEYDYLLVGAGLFNAIFANEAARHNKRCLVVDKRPHVGGNLYCETIEGITVHRYGAHIFHTKEKHIWDYMSRLCEFNNFINSPIAIWRNELYNLPFNMNTFYRLWGVKTPAEAMAKIESQRKKINDPNNFEEYALSLVGTDIYHKLVKGYTEKQWGMDAEELPSFILKRIPLRFIFDNNYFDDPYQGIPKGGYNAIFEKCFRESDVVLETNITDNRDMLSLAEKVIYTGPIDEYYDYCYGPLEYRSLKFEDEVLNVPDFQGNAVVNYTEREIPYTRILEHKHFDRSQSDKTVITREYPLKWSKGLEQYYPVNTERNNILYEKYRQKSDSEPNLVFAGRLGSFSYYNMDQTVNEALLLYNNLNPKP